MKLKVKDGKAHYLMRTGKDIVLNVLDADIAEKIVKNGKITTNTINKECKTFNLCIDKTYYFETEEENLKSDGVSNE